MRSARRGSGNWDLGAGGFGSFLRMMQRLHVQKSSRRAGGGPQQKSKNSENDGRLEIPKAIPMEPLNLKPLTPRTRKSGRILVPVFRCGT